MIGLFITEIQLSKINLEHIIPEIISISYKLIY